jgi:hypothetical protein
VGVSAIGDGASVAEASAAVVLGEERLASGTLLYLCVRVDAVDLARAGGVDLARRNAVDLAAEGERP